MGHARQPVLVVDDDPGILSAMKQNLTAEGYQVDTATNGLEAIEVFEDSAPDLVLLDLTMPGCDGEEVCKYIRGYSSTPIIVLSVRGSESDIASVLDLGADDYLVKPFRMVELLARMRAVLRRAERQRANRVICGELEIDTEKRQVSRAGQIVSLTPIEYALLAELATNMGRVLTSQLLLRRVWGAEYVDSPVYVKVIVYRLRAKLEPDPAHPRYIVTEPHIGYRLTDTI